MSVKDFEILRQHMLVEISAGTFHVSDVIGKAALDERVMAAMGKVPRHEFVPVELQPYAYANIPLPIGFEKTISQPFIVALMTDLLDIGADDTVLEIGTGLGYQAAILAQLARWSLVPARSTPPIGNGLLHWRPNTRFPRSMACASSSRLAV